MADRRAAALPGAARDAAALALTARLAQHGYRVSFPPGRDPAVFKVTGLPGRPDVLENVTFKGIVGLELRALGLDVELAVYCDETAFDTFAEIIATVPGPGNGGGQVCVTDEGGLTWTRDYWAETAAISSRTKPWGQPADPARVACSVVEAVTRAMSLLHPAEAGRAGHG